MAYTTNEAIAAAGDSNLRRRARLAAIKAGADPDVVVGDMDRLASAPVNSAGDTVASIYAYAVAQYEARNHLGPGEDPLLVTDAHLEYAAQHVTGGSS